MKVIILAGGSGTRLWPLSRANFPKQFLKLKLLTFGVKPAKPHPGYGYIKPGEPDAAPATGRRNSKRSRMNKPPWPTWKKATCGTATCLCWVKEVVARLKAAGDPRTDFHLTTYRPWGSYTILEEGFFYKIKRITVLPGKKLSSQLHHHRKPSIGSWCGAPPG